MKKGCVGCLLPALPVILLGLVLILPLMVSVGTSVTSNSDSSSAASAPPSTVCGTSSTKVPQHAVAWMEEAERTSGIPAAWFAAITDRESDFRPHLFADDKNGGTWGLFQINREEWASVHPDATTEQTGTPPGITDPMTHAHYGGIYFKNRLAVVQKLKEDNPDAEFAQLSDLDALVIAHNGGEGSLKKYPKLSKITREYLAEIQAAYNPQPCTTPPGGAPAPGSSGLAGKDDYAGWYAGLPQAVKEMRWDPNGFAWRQCTSYVAFAIRHYSSYKEFNNWWRQDGGRFSDAKHWHVAARKAGIRVDQSPAVGAVAQRLSGTWGHVAYVVAVNGDGTFVINEYNHVTSRGFSSRTARIGNGSHDFTNFLHFEEQG